MAESLVDWGRLGAGYPGGHGRLGAGCRERADWVNGELGVEVSENCRWRQSAEGPGTSLVGFLLLK